jgi:hypothetical protein
MSTEPADWILSQKKVTHCLINTINTAIIYVYCSVIVYVSHFLYRSLTCRDLQFTLIHHMSHNQSYSCQLINQYITLVSHNVHSMNKTFPNQDSISSCIPLSYYQHVLIQHHL